jgi:hypothetical protein
MPQRKVYFYRVFVGRDDNNRRLSFNTAAALREVDQLSFFDEDNGRYYDIGEGDLACCWVDRSRAPQRVRLARSRRSHLPPMDRAGKVQDLVLPEDAGLAEESFLVFFDHGIVGCIYNAFSPRVSVLRRYVRARCSREYHALDFEALLRQDVIDQVNNLDEIRMFELRVSPAYFSQVAQASRTLARALEGLSDLGQPEQVAIVLKPGPYKRNWLAADVLAPIKRLAARRDLREGVDTFKVKGRNADTGTLDEIDVLKDKFVHFVDVELAPGRSSALNRNAAYRAIEAAYADLESDLIAAVGAS